MLKIKERTLTPEVAGLLAEVDTLALTEQWFDAKRREAAANAERVQIEAALVAALQPPDEGQKKFKIGCAAVEIKSEYGYTGDRELLKKLCADLEVDVPLKESIDDGKLKKIYKNNRAAWDLLVESGAASRNKRKPSVTIVTEAV